MIGVHIRNKTNHGTEHTRQQTGQKSPLSQQKLSNHFIIKINLRIDKVQHKDVSCCCQSEVCIMHLNHKSDRRFRVICCRGAQMR